MTDKAISALSAASALAGTEAIPVVQGGATKKSTPAAIATYVATAMPGRLLNYQILTGAANYTPDALCRTLFVRVIGAGGGSCGLPAATANTVSVRLIGGGGGGGAWATKKYTFVAAPAQVAVTCGAGGAAGGAGSNNGADGASTTFDTGAVYAAAVVAPGGKGSRSVTNLQTGASSTFPGAGAAVATGGDVNSAGQPGKYTQNGTTTYDSSIYANQSQGGPSPLGAALEVASALGVNVAAAAGPSGAGATGPISNDGTNAIAGAAGGDGCIEIWEYS